MELKHKSPNGSNEIVQEGNYYKLIYSMMINHVEFFSGKNNTVYINMKTAKISTVGDSSELICISE